VNRRLVWGLGAVAAAALPWLQPDGPPWLAGLCFPAAARMALNAIV
jgi:hypothetical protein